MDTNDDHLDGTLARTADGHLLRFERHIAHPVERVWAALTEPTRIAEWLAPGEFELWPGGRAWIEFSDGSRVDGEVTAVEPPHLLEYTWNETDGSSGPVRWELATDGAGTRLVLTHALPVVRDTYSFMAGWHQHLDLLRLSLGGSPREWDKAHWRQLYEAYQQERAHEGQPRR